MVEEKTCNSERAGKIAAMAKNVELALMKSGNRNNRYGLVGFGGQGVHDAPHMHTIGGQVRYTYIFVWDL